MKHRNRWFIGVSIAALIAIRFFDISFQYYNFENLGDGTGSQVGREILGTVDNLVQMINEQSWSEVYDASVKQVRDASSREEFVVAWSQLSRNVYGIQFIELLELFVADLEKQHQFGEGYMMLMINSDVLPPGVSVFSKMVGYQAFALFKGKTDNGSLPTWLTMVLVQEGDQWKLVDFGLNPAEVAGHDGFWFYKKSLQFESNAQLRNAYFYRGIAEMLLTPSPSIGSVAAAKIRGSSNDRIPLDLPSPNSSSPVDWQINDDMAITVTYVHPVMTSSILWLEIKYQTELTDITSEQAIEERRAVHNYVVEKFPEFVDGFGGIYIGSVREDRQGFRDGFPFYPSGESLIPEWDNP